MKVGADAMLLGAIINTSGKKKGLDIGTGTGVLSLMVAQKTPGILIDAVEVDELSASECAFNFSNSPWNDRLTIIHEDFLHYSSEKMYDLIFSNPPFYRTNLENQDERMARAKHESSLPLRSFVDKSTQLLDEKGKIWLIIPTENVEQWVDSFRHHSLFLQEQVTIFGKLDSKSKRSVISFGFEYMEPVLSELIVRNPDNSYTQQYIMLTREFHGVSL